MATGDRKAVLIESLYYYDYWDNTWVNRNDFACVEGDLTETYEPGAIVVLEETDKPVRAARYDLHYWKVITEEEDIDRNV